jgi:hypothetical protein
VTGFLGVAVFATVLIANPAGPTPVPQSSRVRWCRSSAVRCGPRYDLYSRARQTSLDEPPQL